MSLELESQNQRASFLSGKQSEMIARKTSLMMNSEQAEKTVGMHKDVIARLEMLQTKAVEQSSGVYNELLTAIVHDVMQDIDQTIELTTKVKNNKPQLFIDSTKNGNREDIVSDRGGSINNLISAGLRFIAIVQSGNRRFIAIDEQDCWLEERLVPRFIEVLDKLCKEIGVQCIFISHHDRENTSDKCQIVELNVKDGVIEPIVTQSSNNHEDVEHKMGGEWFDGTGLRYIELSNVMSHHNSKIPLSSSMTALVGGNDIGKSVVIRVIDAFKNNTPTMNLINHDVDTASVKIGLEDDLVLHWSIAKEKSGKKLAKPQYTLFNEDGQIIKTASSAIGVVPEWVDELLSMPANDKIDAHIGNQKDPLFILNPAITPAQRAEMIDLGSEFHVVQKMFELHNENIKGARQVIRQNNAEIAMLNKRLEQLSALTTVNSALQTAGRENNQLSEDESIINQASSALEILRNSNAGLETIRRLKLLTNFNIDEKLFDTEKAQEILSVIQSSSGSQSHVLVGLKQLLKEQVNVVNADDAVRLHQSLSTPITDSSGLVSKIKSLLNEEIKPITSKAASAAKTIKDIETDVAHFKQENDQLYYHKAELEKQWDDAIKAHGDSCPCPTCGQTLTPQPF